MKFWLIQRGKWNRYDKTQSEFSGLTGNEGLIDLDYMGSTEFEIGTIPKAYRRIMAEFEQYELVKTDICNSNSVPLQLFCRKDRTNEIISELVNYIAKPYHLREFSELEKHMKPLERFEGKIIPYMTARTNFWWEVEMDIDCMFFFGVQDRTEIFKSIIVKDYNDWWLAKDEQKRAEDIKNSFSAMY